MDLHTRQWYAMLLPVVLGYLQSISQQHHHHRGSGGDEGAHFNSQMASICFTIALVALTASRPIACSSKAAQICLFNLILGCALLLSSAVPNRLCWAPYFSCIRPLFHLLPRPFQLLILHFFQCFWDDLKQKVLHLFELLPDPFRRWILQFSHSARRLVAAGAGPNTQPSSPKQANFSSEQVELVELGVQGVSSTDASPSLRSSSSQAQLNLEQVHVHLTEDMDSL